MVNILIFFYADFKETHRIIKLQRLISLCSVGLEQPFKCTEFQ